MRRLVGNLCLVLAITLHGLQAQAGEAEKRVPGYVGGPVSSAEGEPGLDLYFFRGDTIANRYVYPVKVRDSLTPPAKVYRDGKEIKVSDVHKGELVDIVPDKDGYPKAIHVKPAIRPKARLEAGRSGLSDVIFSADGKLMATSAYYDREVRLWDARTRKPIRTITVPWGGPARATFSPDSKLIAVTIQDPLPTDDSVRRAMREPRLRLWDVAGGKAVQALFPGMNAPAYAFSPDGKLLYAALRDSTVRVLEPHTGKEVRQFNTGESAILALAIGGDGKALFTADQDRKVRKWELPALKEQKVSQPRAGSATHFIVSPRDRYYAVVGPESIGVWGRARDNRRPGVAAVGPIAHCAFSPDNALLAVATGSGVRVYDIRTHVQMCVAVLRDKPAPFWTVAFTPDGKTLAAAGRTQKEVLFWDVSAIPLLPLSPKLIKANK